MKVVFYRRALAYWIDVQYQQHTISLTERDAKHLRNQLNAKLSLIEKDRREKQNSGSSDPFDPLPFRLVNRGK